MWAILQSIVFSAMAIVLFHYCWEYIKNTYSVRKTKDLVKIQTEKYNSILSEVLETKRSLEPDIDADKMEQELALFLEQSMSGLSYDDKSSTDYPPIRYSE
jgi:hypothetical protein